MLVMLVRPVGPRRQRLLCSALTNCRCAESEPWLFKAPMNGSKGSLTPGSVAVFKSWTAKDSGVWPTSSALWPRDRYRSGARSHSPGFRTAPGFLKRILTNSERL